MDIRKFMKQDGEKPLDNIVSNGGFTSIFRTIACVGDSLASGEFDTLMDGKRDYFHDFDYSWGQFMARDTGSKVYNLSRGGMTAMEYYTSFAGEKGFWDEEYKAQAYVIALGANDITRALAGGTGMGEVDDIDKETDTFASYYARIIRKYKEIEPRARFFVVTMPRGLRDDTLSDKHREIMYAMAEKFDNCYVIDLREYGPEIDEEYRKNFFIAGHRTATGYRLTALMVESYIDYIIRNNPEDFKQVSFIGTPYYYEK